MSEPRPAWTDERVEQVMGNLLRFGVLAAAAVVAVGGIVYLIRHGSEQIAYHVFHSEPGIYRTPSLILESAFSGQSRGIIQLGLLILIATPVLRVAFSVFAFLRQRDYTYVVLTLLVLTILLFSLFFGQ